MHLNLTCPLFFLILAPSAAFAQTQAQAESDRAGTPGASSSVYQSAFADYKAYKEPVLMSWREANDQVGATGGMQGHDMATMKPRADDPHAGHDMSKMGAAPAQRAPADRSIDSPTQNAPAGIAAQGAKKVHADDAHAGHDMSTMTQPATPAAARNEGRLIPKEKGSQAGSGAQVVDEHAGHNMSEPAKPKQGSADKERK